MEGPVHEQIAPVYPKGEESDGRRPVGLERSLRGHFLQQWYALSDPAVQEALYDFARDVRVTLASTWALLAVGLRHSLPEDYAGLLTGL